MSDLNHQDEVRVGYVALAPFISGAERSLQLLLEHAPSVGIAPVVFAPPNSPLLDWCAGHHVAHEATPLPLPERTRPWIWLNATRRLRRFVRQHRLRILHSNQHWSYPHVQAAASGCGCRRVCHLRDEISPKDVEYFLRGGSTRSSQSASTSPRNSISPGCPDGPDQSCVPASTRYPFPLFHRPTTTRL